MKKKKKKNKIFFFGMYSLENKTFQSFMGDSSEVWNRLGIFYKFPWKCKQTYGNYCVQIHIQADFVHDSVIFARIAGQEFVQNIC